MAAKKSEQSEGITRARMAIDRVYLGDNIYAGRQLAIAIDNLIILRLKEAGYVK